MKGFFKKIKLISVRKVGDFLDIYFGGVTKLLREVAPLSNGRFLDVGCGRKPHLHLFKSYITEYVGVENIHTFKLTRDSLDVSADYYYEGDRLPFTDESFDTVASFSVLEHTPEPWVLFNEMSRVLKIDGLMIQHVPFSFRLHEEPHDYYRFSPYALKDLCDKNGLLVEKILSQGSLWSIMGHKIITFLVYTVLRYASVAQSVNKLGMESNLKERPRHSLLPIVFPIIFMTVVITRCLEKFVPVEGDSLAYLLVARKVS